MSEAQGKRYRYERKFVIRSHSRSETEGLIRLHPTRFVVHYPQRWVNNIYLDSPNWRHYADNLSGTGERTKVRIRWYGDLQPVTFPPLLEIKMRKGHVGTKERFELPAPKVSESTSPDAWLSGLQSYKPGSRARLACLGLEPVIMNRYLRSYFISPDGAFRITVDTGLSHYPFLGVSERLRQARKEDKVILELKYDAEHDPRVSEITGHLPIRPEKNSKYVSGVELLYGH